MPAASSGCIREGNSFDIPALLQSLLGSRIDYYVEQNAISGGDELSLTCCKRGGQSVSRRAFS
jgi:hypothetical protein